MHHINFDCGLTDNTIPITIPPSHLMGTYTAGITTAIFLACRNSDDESFKNRKRVQRDYGPVMAHTLVHARVSVLDAMMKGNRMVCCRRLSPKRSIFCRVSRRNAQKVFVREVKS